MTKVLANLKIRMKLLLLLGSGLVPMIVLSGLALWGLMVIRGAVDQEQASANKMIIAQHAAADMGRVTNIVGHIVLGGDCQTCHGVATGGEREHQANLVKSYLSILKELQTAETSQEGKRLAGELETAGTRWHGINANVMRLSELGKRADAIEAYRSESIPGYAPVDKALQDYLNWQQPQMAGMKTLVNTYTTRIPIAIGVLSLLVLCTAVLLGTAMTRSITKPLAAAVTSITAVADGDITGEIDKEHLERTDEFGEMACAVRTMSLGLREMIQEITGGIRILSSSSSELMANSAQMSEESHQASEKAHSVATAAEELSANAASVAAAMEQTAGNLSHVSTSTEQMTATISEIAGNSEKARSVTADATRQASRLAEQFNELGKAAREIGTVTETITEISSQINLLALNATIESARAGVAGKGFAVVASEIKILAQQTATASDDIKTRIAGVQSATTSRIVEIEGISHVIREVSEFVTSIAAAIEEQAVVTKDIAQNIGQASHGVGDANVRVSESSQASQEIAQSILSVDLAASQLADGSAQVRTSSAELSEVAKQLQAAVARFRVST